MVYYVYILCSPSSGKFYIGQTEDTQARLDRHNSLEHDGWTKSYQPWQLFWSVELPSRKSAMKVERYLKKKRRLFLRRLVTDNSLVEYILQRDSELKRLKETG